jgi:protocatechuate 3,4-dioxygenase beta subunit
MGWANMKAETQPPANSAKQQTKKDKTPEQKAEDAKDARKDEDPNIRYQAFSVSGRAVDPEGKAVAGATIFLVSTNGSPQEGLLGTTTTDKDGQYTFHDAKLPYRVKTKDDEWEAGSFEVFGKCSGRAFAWGGLKGLVIDPRFKDAKNAVPASKDYPLYYFPNDRIKIGLEFASPKKVEGQIVDEKGKPIAGFKVRLANCDYINTAGKEEDANRREFWAIYQAPNIMPDQVCATTDDKGRFEFSSVPPDVFCWLLLEHPGYAQLALYTATAGNPPATHDEGKPVLKLPLHLIVHSTRTINVQVRSKQDDKPLADIRISGNQQRASGYSSYGTSDKEGKVTLKLPPGKYHLDGRPSRESDYARTSEDFTVEEAPAEQSVVLRQQLGCILILKAIDADTGKGVPKIGFWYDTEVDGRQATTSVQSSTVYVDNPVTNDKGELRAVVQPGTFRFGTGFGPLPSEYEPVASLQGRELVLPAGKTITETFKFRKKK